MSYLRRNSERGTALPADVERLRVQLATSAGPLAVGRLAALFVEGFHDCRGLLELVVVGPDLDVASFGSGSLSEGLAGGSTDSQCLDAVFFEDLRSNTRVDFVKRCVNDRVVFCGRHLSILAHARDCVEPGK